MTRTRGILHGRCYRRIYKTSTGGSLNKFTPRLKTSRTPEVKIFSFGTFLFSLVFYPKTICQYLEKNLLIFTELTHVKAPDVLSREDVEPIRSLLWEKTRRGTDAIVASERSHGICRLNVLDHFINAQDDLPWMTGECKSVDHLHTPLINMQKKNTQSLV